jgi:hypothetical protein
LGVFYLNLACACLGWVHLDIGGCGRPRRHPLLIALAVRIVDTEIVLGVLVEIFRGDPIAASRARPM